MTNLDLILVVTVLPVVFGFIGGLLGALAVRPIRISFCHDEVDDD